MNKLINDRLINSLNELADISYQVAKEHGFHEDDEKDDVNCNNATIICDTHAQVSDLWESHRKNELDDEKLLEKIDVEKLSVVKDDSFFPRYVANLHGEVTELYDAFVDDKLYTECDKTEKLRELNLPELCCAEEELADIIIRCLDTAKTLNLDIGRAISVKTEYNRSRSYRHGEKKA